MIENANGNRPPSPPYQAGVTLIELLVALMVLAVFVTIGIPTFTSVFERHRLTGAAQGLYADLQFARAESIKRNRKVSVNFDTAKWCYGITDTQPFSNCDCGTASAASCTVNGQKYTVDSDRFPGVTMSISSATGTVEFDPVRGTLWPSSTLHFTGGGHEVDVITHYVGRVRICGKDGFGGFKSC